MLIRKVNEIVKSLALPLLLALLCLSQESLAYGCSEPRDVREALEGRSPLVFTGTVSDIEHWTPRMTAVQFTVETVHRGNIGKSVVVLFGLDGRQTKWRLGERYSISAGLVTLSGTPERTPRLFGLGKNYNAYVCDLVARDRPMPDSSPRTTAGGVPRLER